MDKKHIEDIEYSEICRNLKLDTEMRNKLLTFSFTVVLTALGVALSVEDINIFVFILPYFVIIPFTGRLCYYRRWNAHMTSFLNTFAKEKRVYNCYTDKVHIDKGIKAKIVAWLVNYEMLFLSIACMFVFWIKYPVVLQEFNYKDYLYCSLPLSLTIFDFCLITSTYNYEKMKKEYDDKFKVARDEE